MPVIELQTEIDAPLERCYLLSLSVDLHVHSAEQTGERIVRGVTNGVMKERDSVTWRAKHFGVTQDLTSVVHDLRFPSYFVSEMTEGTFKKLYHQHIFEPIGTGTMMTDKFDFEAPLGILGKIVSALVLKNYMARFLKIRNTRIKQVAESDEWKRFVKE
jgi:ligand-binding SRPBCC domain-containing protein